MNEKVVYNVEEIKELLGIGRKQAYELVNSGEFRIVRVGKKILVPKDNFDQWLYGKKE